MSETSETGSDDRVPIDTAAVWPEDTDAEEGVVTNWFAREGRAVEAGETVCEIQVEKVGIDVAAPAAGTLETIALAEGDEFVRGETLGWISRA
jgi:pyruvate/2-oxoglutarate dehydrogenase complex dihydrolipoamide acyltransferase (E2) component